MVDLQSADHDVPSAKKIVRKVNGQTNCHYNPNLSSLSCNLDDWLPLSRSNTIIRRCFVNTLNDYSIVSGVVGPSYQIS